MNYNAVFLKEVKEIKAKIKILKLKLQRKNKKLLKVNKKMGAATELKNLLIKAYSLAHLLK